jgi:hypothetical protein
LLRASFLRQIKKGFKSIAFNNINGIHSSTLPWLLRNLGKGDQELEKRLDQKELT